MLKKIIPQHQLKACKDALVAHLGSQGECLPKKFDVYVEAFIERDVLQRVGAVRIVQQTINLPYSPQRDNAQAFMGGEVMPPDILAQFYERGIRYVSGKLRNRSTFTKLDNEKYCLRDRHKEPVVVLKLCTSCKQKKTASQFQTNKNYSDGLHNWCKTCTSQYAKDIQENRRNDPNWLASVEPVEKCCKGCGEVLPVSCFPIAYRMRDGHTNFCKACTSRKNKVSRNKNKQPPFVESKAAPLFCLTNEPP